MGRLRTPVMRDSEVDSFREAEILSRREDFHSVIGPMGSYSTDSRPELVARIAGAGVVHDVDSVNALVRQGRKALVCFLCAKIVKNDGTNSHKTVGSR